MSPHTRRRGAEADEDDDDRKSLRRRTTMVGGHTKLDLLLEAAWKDKRPSLRTVAECVRSVAGESIKNTKDDEAATENAKNPLKKLFEEDEDDRLFLKQCGAKHVAHFSPQRTAKRVMGVEISDVFIPTSPAAWNFSKIKQLETEALLVGESVEDLQKPEFKGKNRKLAPLMEWNDNRVYVLANLHPIAALHILLIPQGVGEQFLTADGLLTALQFARRTARLRLTFNGMGAGASVNHLHWQGVAWPQKCGIDSFPRKPVVRVSDGSGEGSSVVEICRIPGWHLHSMCEVRQTVASKSKSGKGCGLEVLNKTSSAADRLLHAVVMRIVTNMQQRNVTHNVTVCPGGLAEKSNTMEEDISIDSHDEQVDKALRPQAQLPALRVMVAARDFFCPQSKNPGAMALASLESLGHWIIPSRENFESATEQSLDSLMESLSIPEEVFKHQILNFDADHENFLVETVEEDGEAQGE